MPQTNLSREQFLAEMAKCRKQGLKRTQAAAKIGVTERKLSERLARMGMKYTDFPPAAPTVSRIRSANMDFTDLVSDRIRTFKRKKNHEDDLAALTIDIPGRKPYVIVFLGDPHVDDDGCDWIQLRRHIALIQATDGLYAVNMGDTTNNWVGRLARLYENQRTTSAEALILARGFIKALTGKWLFAIGGNHDMWSGAHDPLPDFFEAAEATYLPVGAKVKVKAGKHELFINARHKPIGHSMWNTAHGVGRSILMGNTDHITVCGHAHTTGQMVIKAPSGRICYGLQVASYKVIDSYAKEGGFRDNHISPAAMVVVDPRCPDTDPAMLTVFHSVERGADYLRFLREP